MHPGLLDCTIVLRITCFLCSSFTLDFWAFYPSEHVKRCENRRHRLYLLEALRQRSLYEKYEDNYERDDSLWLALTN